MNVLLVGPIRDSINIDKINYDLCIAVDRGVVRASERKLDVDIAIGDFDSLNDKEKDLLFEVKKVIKMNAKKDSSDLECALEYLSLRHDIHHIYAFGFLYGNRLDHLLTNIFLLYKYKMLNVLLLAKKSCIYLLKKGNYYLEKNGYKYISFYSLNRALINLKKGFKYQVENDIISPVHLKYLSNEIILDKAYIENMDDIIVIQSND
ncbi:MAG: thiamine diphosphokinase [Bacilli bacterium]|nr:thiamine diphosphokinase [Bacilli bacterium]